MVTWKCPECGGEFSSAYEERHNPQVKCIYCGIMVDNPYYQEEEKTLIPMKVEVVKEFTFDAAHFLPGHPGKCRRVHGHTYRLQVGFKGICSESGIVVDFGTLKAIINDTIIEKLDHMFLNEIGSDPGFPTYRPTAELMVIWIVKTLNTQAKIVLKSVKLSFVRLYETPTSYAEWRETF